MYSKVALASLSLLSLVRGQGAGTLTPEVHPPITWSTCAAGGVCTAKSGSVVIDANWRWVHDSTGTNCYTGNSWTTNGKCPDPVTCAANCYVDGAAYQSTYGISTASNSLTLGFVTVSQQANIGSRVYLMASDTAYQTFLLKNMEFTFDVNMANLPCGLNGALYFVQMDADGGLAKNPGNKAGAKYGTGYCDAQCPQDLKFINGKANNVGWTPSTNDPNSGTGLTGACCTEMDIWEANIAAAAYTPHICSGTGVTACTGTACGNGADRFSSSAICDKDGCDFNSYRLGNTSFLGPGKTIDTSKTVTVVTQFITNDNTATGTLTAIKRYYVQNGVVFSNSNTNIAGIDTTNSITDSFCSQEKAAFGDNPFFGTKGGFAAFSNTLNTPMVLVMSIWDDHTANMNWLDSTYPVGGTAPGNARGPCDPLAGVPATVEAAHPGASVTFSNIKFGPIGSTFNQPAAPGGGGSSSSVRTTTTTSRPASSTTRAVTTTTTSRLVTTTRPAVPTTTTTTAPAATTTAASGGAPHWGQCGGQPPYAGPFTCAPPYTCVYSNPYFSQCL